jgi:hypothetical protein
METIRALYICTLHPKPVFSPEIETLLDLPVVGESDSIFSNNPGYGARWPGPLPKLRVGERFRHAYWVNAGDHLVAVCMTDLRKYGDGQCVIIDHAYALPCKPDSEYWPTAAACAEQLPAWTEKMRARLAKAAEDEDEIEHCRANLAEHWERARRRYGAKHNPMVNFFYTLGIDPEWRISLDVQIPPHIVEAMRAVDRAVALAVGVVDIDEDRLVSSDCLR